MFDVCTTGYTAHTAAMQNIDAPMLTRMWQELEYRIDVCRVTCGAHIEYLWLSKHFFSFPAAVNNSKPLAA
jgi:hypothetical protein